MARARVVVLVGGLVVLTVLTTLLATRTRSPQQAAADAAPPDASTLTTAVERRVLQERIITRGTVVTASTVQSVPAGQAGLTPVVTDARVAPGSLVEEGIVAVVVAGRPVITLRGSFPSYRDLVPGSQGPDVLQLQAALLRLGYDIGVASPDGSFGVSTARAVEAWYAALGFQAAKTSDDVETQRRQAQRAVEDALVRLERAQEAMSSANGPVPADAIEDAERALARAQEELSRVLRTTGTKVPRDELQYVPALPAAVSAIAPIGARVDSEHPALVLSSGLRTVRTIVPAAQASLLTVGMESAIRDDAARTDTSGRVASIGAQVVEDAATRTRGREVVVEPTADLGAIAIGTNVRLTFTTVSSGEPVLVVPLSAIRARADGSTAVRVLRKDRVERIEVTVGLQAGGYVSVTAPAAALRPADRVVIGQIDE